GGVNMYREERFATWKQRMLLAAETILCPHPGCTTPASQCQVHHLTAWEQGGETNIENLSMACAVHNARNDDDPNAPPRNGRLERRPGGVVHLPPDGGPPRENIHPIRQLSAMALINA
ncbi:MAG: HNH endonuclease, partial [Corynebacterium humireducens]|nr:HNH endonuclease [Corynebacterium humireducens]